MADGIGTGKTIQSAMAAVPMVGGIAAGLAGIGIGIAEQRKAKKEAAAAVARLAAVPTQHLALQSVEDQAAAQQFEDTYAQGADYYNNRAVTSADPYRGQADASLGAFAGDGLASQQAALAAYQAQASGTGPSVAQAQGYQGLQNAMQGAQMAQGAARGGDGQAAGTRAAMMGAQQQSTQAAIQAAQARAQEVESGMSGYAGQGGQMVGQGLTYAGLEQARNQFDTNSAFAQEQANRALAQGSAASAYNSMAQQSDLAKQLAFHNNQVELAKTGMAINVGSTNAGTGLQRAQQHSAMVTGVGAGVLSAYGQMAGG